MRSLDSDVTVIVKQIAQGDVDAAQRAFTIAANKTTISEVARALGRASHPPAGSIVVGPSLIVYANPYRDDNYSWRCGDCPWTANNYKTRRGAEKSADTHAEEHPGIRVRWITRPIGA